ncbi:MAG TPA: hypothetical protein VFJ10_13015, partial [Acidobacteriaceae bacterium]|nr:hypothetical protein [Acidobacteriaceae bacterium]
MQMRLILLVAIASTALGQSVPHASQTPAQKSAIRFEDATAKAGIDFGHSFGSAKLSSLLEGTGSGCVWFDANNDGLPDLYVLSGTTLPASLTPSPLQTAPDPAP